MWEQRYGFPEPAARRPATASTPPTTSSCCGASSSCARRACPCRRRSSAPAQRAPITEHPSIFGAVPARGPVAPAAQADADRAVARDRGPDAGQRRAADRPRGLPARAHYRKVEHRYRRMAQTADLAAVFADFDRPSSDAGAPVEVPIDATRRSATSGRSSSTRRASPSAWPPGSRRSPSRRPTSWTGSSRRSGRWTPTPCARRRGPARASRATARRRSPTASRRCSRPAHGAEGDHRGARGAHGPDGRLPGVGLAAATIGLRERADRAVPVKPSGCAVAT